MTSGNQPYLIHLIKILINKSKLKKTKTKLYWDNSRKYCRRILPNIKIKSQIINQILN